MTLIDQYWMNTFGTYSPGPYLCSYSFCSWFIPLTAPFHSPVASTDSRCGISMICDGVLSFLPPPIWNAESEHGWQLSHCASAAAIFIGWYLVSISPSLLPTNICTRITGKSTITERVAER